MTSQAPKDAAAVCLDACARRVWGLGSACRLARTSSPLLAATRDTSSARLLFLLVPQPPRPETSVLPYQDDPSENKGGSAGDGSPLILRAPFAFGFAIGVARYSQKLKTRAGEKLTS